MFEETRNETHGADPTPLPQLIIIEDQEATINQLIQQLDMFVKGKLSSSELPAAINA